MRILVTGHNGYIGTTMVPLLKAAGHEVMGLDSNLFRDCTFGPTPEQVPELQRDVRDVRVEDLEGFDAVAHLAAISNDPVGDLNPDLTYDVNYRASVRLAELARAAGVSRFLFSSSCSLYGKAGDEALTEEADFNPVTPYGESKVLAEREISDLASDDFSPTFLRNATAYGVSRRLRADLVVNNLVGYAVTTGEVMIKSDGTPWRPLVHIEDISRAFLAMLEARRDVVHDQAFNVGATEENYQVRAVADMVQDTVPGSRVAFAPGGGADIRDYQVDCSKLFDAVEGFELKWSVPRGVRELAEAYGTEQLSVDDLTGPRFVRIRRIQELQDQGLLDDDLRWRADATEDGVGAG